jgi:predicted MFS family arabinose efflux permease
MAKTPPRTISPRRWYWATFVIFAGQGIMATAFWTRSPEIEHLLGIDVALMGVLGFLNSIGGLIGILGGGKLVPRFGVRNTMIFAYATILVSLTMIGVSAGAHSVLGTAIFLVTLGTASGLGGLAINLEGSAVDRASSRSLLPSLHGAFSAGTLIGSACGALLIATNVNLNLSFALICAIYVVAMASGVPSIPRYSGRRFTEDMDTQAIAAVPTKEERRGVLRERRLWGVLFIVFGFTLGEAVAGTWIPIALVNGVHMTAADAGLGLSIYFAGMTLGRFTGGFSVDFLGRARALAIYALVAVIGISIVISSPMTQIPYLGTFLWGVGLSIGFPLCVSAISYEPRLVSSRVSYLATTGSVSVTVGPPLLGVLAQFTSLLAVFTIPAALLLSGLFANKNTRLAPEELPHHETILDEA